MGNPLEDRRIPITDELVKMKVEPTIRPVIGIWSDEMVDPGIVGFFAGLEKGLSPKERVAYALAHRNGRFVKEVAPGVFWERTPEKTVLRGAIIENSDPRIQIDGFIHIGESIAGSQTMAFTLYEPGQPGRIPIVGKDGLRRLDFGLHRDEPTREQVKRLLFYDSRIGEMLHTSFFYYYNWDTHDTGVGKVVTLPPGVDDPRERAPIRVGDQGERYVYGFMTAEDRSLMGYYYFNLIMKVSLPPLANT